MPYIPENVATNELSEKLASCLGRPRQGKVRDTYSIPGNDSVLLPVATDRLSIFDFVLGTLVPDKGAVLTALTVMWLTSILRQFPNHLVAYGRGIDAYLPEELRGDPELQKRALIVKKLAMSPVECVVRGYLTGSGWAAYQKTGEVCGHRLPAGLHDGAKLAEPLYTPTTKAEEGHDEHLPAEEAAARYGRHLGLASLAIFEAASRYAEHRGIILADTKFEFGSAGGAFMLGDEVLTPDSSRFWLARDWEKAALQRKSPAGYDKEPVRQWGKTVVTPFNKLSVDMETVVGIHKLDPANPAHQKFAGSAAVPQEVAASATQRYRQAFRMLAGSELEVFQASMMQAG